MKIGMEILCKYSEHSHCDHAVQWKTQLFWHHQEVMGICDQTPDVLDL